MTGGTNCGALQPVGTQSSLPVHTSIGRHEDWAEAGVQISTRQDRELAVGTWFLPPSDITERACQEARPGGIALLRCSPLFAALRISAGLIRSAAGARAADTVNEYLPQVLRGGPTLIDLHNRSHHPRELP